MARLEPPGRDAKVSAIFYFFESLTSLGTGRTVGRKIGIVQEILLRKYLERNYELRRRLYLEQRLQGRSEAFHKVEFSWFAKSTAAGLKPASKIPHAQASRIIAIDPTAERVHIGVVGIGSEWCRPGVAIRRRPLRNYLDERNLDLRVVAVDNGTATIDVIDRTRLLASLESKRVGAQRFSASAKLGSGIQTIEKAKQASLVAIDLDLRHNGSVKPLQEPTEAKTLISLVALGNGVHWTVKDRAVLRTYVDYCYLVKDEAIIRYAEYVKNLAGVDEFLPFFMGYFQGLTQRLPDDFETFDEDFRVVAPEGESRTLEQVLIDHVGKVNP